jgi:hypothetical protein
LQTSSSGSCTIVSVASSQRSTVQSRLSVVAGGVPAVQVPVTQLSVPLQKAPSSHSASMEQALPVQSGSQPSPGTSLPSSHSSSPSTT